MSTPVKLTIVLILLALLGGWFFIGQSKDIKDIDVIPTEMAETNTEADHNHDHGTNPSNDNIAEEGIINILPIDPVLGRRGVGNPNAPVKIQEFFSLTCNHCANFHTGTYQELKAKYIDTGKVYFIFEEFPLNGPALYGSMIARCMPEERYESFVDLLLRNQDVWAFSGDFKASLMQNAKLAGMSEEEFNTCFNNEALQKAMANNIAAASDAWKISSTPSFVLNDGERIIRGGKSIADFSAVIDRLLEASQAPAAEITE